MIPLLFWAWNRMGNVSPDKPVRTDNTLASAINTCDGIAEKSVARLTAVVNFQQLEIAGRRARVLQNCMNDHGFVENPAWAKFAAPIAQIDASSQHISVDEAYENLRRSKMLLFTESNQEPLYWVNQAAK